QGRVVEHQAGRVMAVERRADPELRAELGFLVRAHARIAVALRHVGIARQEHAAVGQALDWREAAPRVVARERGIGEGLVEAGQMEALGQGARLVLGQLAQNCSSFSANTVRPAAFSGPSWASAGGRITSAKKRAVITLASRKAGSPSRAASLA